MQTLEALALKEADPQVHRAADWALAAAAIGARSGPSPGVAARPGTARNRVFTSPISIWYLQTSTPSAVSLESSLRVF